MPDRRRQRQQRVRQEAGGGANSVGASNREPEKEKTPPNVPKVERQGGSGVAYAEPKEYESVTIMPDKDKEKMEPQKYRRREVLSNWSRYEELPTDQPEEGEDYLIGEDFSKILEQQAISTGGHLQLKDESLWDKSEENILNTHGLGALRVSDLVAAINTIPLHMQLNIPEDLLPESMLEFYTNLADDNRKLYKPSESYKDCLDVSEKILQSLKISDSEPLNLSTEESESRPSVKNAVDVALSLTDAFAPEPDDVDLETLVREPSPVKQPTPTLERQPSPVKQPSPAPQKQPSPAPQKQPSPAPQRQPDPVKQPSPVPERQPSPVKQPSPAPEKQPNPVKQPSPAPERQPDPVKQPTPVRDTAPKTVGFKPTKEQSPALEDKSSIRRGKSKEKSPASFDFGLPNKNVSSDKPSMQFNFGLVNGSESVNPKPGKGGKDMKMDIDISNPVKLEEKKEEIPDGPTVDLDAPVEPTKPVLLISKTEAEDLEDWLDSVLDD